MLHFIRTYRQIAFPLVFLMFFTSTGFSVDIHYCQGKLKSISLLGEAQSCFEKAQKSPCKKHATTCHAHIDKESHKGCCDNETFFIQLDADYPLGQINTLTWEQVTSAFSFLWSFIFSFHDRDYHTIIPHQNYKPPLLDLDIPVLFQSFLL